MKMLFAVAALLLASSAAQAQYTFQYGGRTIHVDPDRGTVSIPGVYDNTGKRSKRHSDQDSDRSRKQTPQEAKTDPHAPATEATPAPAPAPAEQTPPATANAPPPPPPVPSTATATVAPADTITSTQPPALTPPPLPQDQPDAAPAKPETPPVAATPCPRQTGNAACRRYRATRAATGAAGPRATKRSQFAGRPLADRGEGRQGPDRAVRRQSLRIFGGRQIERERRAGSDQYEAGQGQMDRANLRSEIRFDL